MAKKFLVLVFAAALIAGFSMPAAAGDLAGPPLDYTYPGYVDAPDWSSKPYYTRQSWDMLPVADPAAPGTYMGPTPPFGPDASANGGPATVNPYGDPMLISTGPRVGYTGENLEHAWEFTDYGMGMVNETFYGHVGGMGSGYTAFDIPNSEVNLTQDIWLQYIVYLPRGGAGPDGSALTSFFLDAPVFDPVTGDPTNTAVGTMLSKEFEQLEGPGYSGYWWRVTEEWQLDSQPAEEWLWLASSGEGGAATLFDSVDIQTSAVPIPGAVWLFGSGIIALIGVRRKRS